MLDKYSPKIQKLLKKQGIAIGQRIRVSTGRTVKEGYLMPKSSGDMDTIVIKLDNGYNAGIIYGKGVKIQKLKEKREPKKAALTVKKYKPDTKKPTIAIIHTGGTVASRIDYKTGGVTTLFEPEDIYQAVPELRDIANIKMHMLFQMWSQDMEPEHWITIAKRVEEEIETGVDGVIITHGTDTIAYTAAALTFFLQDLPIPVLIVGSQRSSDRGSSDAAMNLICAARFIAKSDYAGIGVCMHANMDDKFCYIHDPVNVKKMHTSRRDAFRSIDVYPIAKVEPDGDVTFFREYMKKEKRKVIVRSFFQKKIAIVKMRPGFSHRELEFYEKEGYKGVVIEGTGLGHGPTESTDSYTEHHEKLLNTMKRMSEKGIILIMTSSCPYGKVNLQVYAPQRKTLDAGVVPLRMTTETAFVKLGWALGQTSQRKDVINILNTNIAGEIVERIDPRVFLF